MRQFCKESKVPFNYIHDHYTLPIFLACGPLKWNNRKQNNSKKYLLVLTFDWFSFFWYLQPSCDSHWCIIRINLKQSSFKSCDLFVNCGRKDKLTYLKLEINVSNYCGSILHDSLSFRLFFCSASCSEERKNHINSIVTNSSSLSIKLQVVLKLLTGSHWVTVRVSTLEDNGLEDRKIGFLQMNSSPENTKLSLTVHFLYDQSS